MASPSSLLICALFLLSTSTVFVFVSCFQFQLGWIKPTNKTDADRYDNWAERNRFHIGDTVKFRYENDSLLIVDREDYNNCTVTNPIKKFADGNTVFRFERYGFFYFISGEPGHCKSGQKLVIRVMVHSDVAQAPGMAPTQQQGSGPSAGGGDWGGGVVTPNSTDRLPVASYFMTALGGMMVILYLFM